MHLYHLGSLKKKMHFSTLRRGCWFCNFPNIYTKTNKIFEIYVKIVEKLYQIFAMKSSSGGKFDLKIETFFQKVRFSMEELQAQKTGGDHYYLISVRT